MTETPDEARARREARLLDANTYPGHMSKDDWERVPHAIKAKRPWHDRAACPECIEPTDGGSMKITDAERERLWAVLYPTGDTDAIRGRVTPVVESILTDRLERIVADVEQGKIQPGRDNWSRLGVGALLRDAIRDTP